MCRLPGDLHQLPPALGHTHAAVLFQNRTELSFKRQCSVCGQAVPTSASSGLFEHACLSAGKVSMAFPRAFGQSCHAHHPETSAGTASHQAGTAKPSSGVGSGILEKQKREGMSVLWSSSLEKSWELQQQTPTPMFACEFCSTAQQVLFPQLQLPPLVLEYFVVKSCKRFPQCFIILAEKKDWVSPPPENPSLFALFPTKHTYIS